MHQKLKAICIALCVIIVSCKDTQSIQTYVVEHQDKPEFLTLDLSPKMLDFSKAELTQEQLDTYNSFKKMNIIAYKAEGNTAEAYTKELEKAKAVFKNEKYNELMEFSDSGIKFRINTIGNNDKVDEFLVLASSSDLGFAVVRVLGDNMQPEKLYKLLDEAKNADFDNLPFEKVMNYFKQ